MSLDRRNVIKAAAWTVPVVVLAVATPAAAASASCKKEVYVFSSLTQHDVASITVVTGEYVMVRYEKDYPNATGITVHGLPKNPYWKSLDNGVKAGTDVLIPLKAFGVCDPKFIQVDGNNTHYYGGGVFR